MAKRKRSKGQTTELQNIRDRPFNLKGGEGGLWFFVSVQKFVFGQHKS